MRNTTADFYKNKKVLVTGHTGFKGSWLALWLLEMGARVSGLSLEPNTDPSLFRILGLERKIDHHIADIRDHDALSGVVQKTRPEIIFHLAAQPLVRYSYFHPKETYETNVLGTVNLLEAARSTDSVRSAVCITSDKCYENREWVYGYRENDPMGGYDPYSSSKGCAELVIASYRNTYFNPQKHGADLRVALASARAGNVIGGGDWAADRLVPDCARSIAAGDEIILRNPGAVRPWQHVLDPLFGYLLLAKKMSEDPVRFCGAWNFGPDDRDIIPVEHLVADVIKYWGRGSYRIKNESSIHEANLLKLDTSKARMVLQWVPALSLKEAVERTVFWYKSFYEKNDMHQISLGQIHEYMKLAGGQYSTGA